MQIVFQGFSMKMKGKFYSCWELSKKIRCPLAGRVSICSKSLTCGKKDN